MTNPIIPEGLVLVAKPVMVNKATLDDVPLTSLVAQFASAFHAEHGRWPTTGEVRQGLDAEWGIRPSVGTASVGLRQAGKPKGEAPRRATKGARA